MTILEVVKELIGNDQITVRDHRRITQLLSSLQSLTFEDVKRLEVLRQEFSEPKPRHGLARAFEKTDSDGLIDLTAETEGIGDKVFNVGDKVELVQNYSDDDFSLHTGDKGKVLVSQLSGGGSEPWCLVSYNGMEIGTPWSYLQHDNSDGK